MKINSRLILVAAAASFILYGCNSGSSSSSSTTTLYLPAGTYTGAITNISPVSCQDNVESNVTFTSDGNGTVCDGPDCVNLNIAANPCYSINETTSGVTVAGNWSNCSLNSSTNVMTALMSITASYQGETASCTANVTLSPVNTTTQK